MKTLIQATRRLPTLCRLRQPQSPSFRPYSYYATHIRLFPAWKGCSTTPPCPSIDSRLPRLSPLPQLLRLQPSLKPGQIPLAPFSGRCFHNSVIFAAVRPANTPSEKSEAQLPQKDVPSNGASKPKNEAETPGEQQSQADEEGGESNKESKKDKNEDSDKDGRKEEDASAPPPPHGDKTPWQVFTETMSSEFEKSKEWNENSKAIASSAHQFTESESVRRARQAYETTSGAASNAIKSTAGAIGRGAVWTWDTPVVKGVRKVANVTGDAMEKATRPIRETEAYKNVRDVIDDGSSSRYGGWVEKEERRRKREMQKLQNGQGLGPAEAPQEDPNAGTNVTLHKDSAWKEAWRDFRDSNKFVQGLFTVNKAYKESDNPLVSTARSITDRIGGFFAENEFAEVIKQLRTMEPGFQLDPFIRDLREYILPEVLDAYVKGDTETLKLWLSAAQYSVYEALTKQYLQAGLRSDGRILDIRNVDIVRARLLDPGDVPVFIITARTQEVHVYRNAKTGELAAGMEDKVQQVTYAIGVTRVAEDANNPETRGWRLIEMQKSGRDWY